MSELLKANILADFKYYRRSKLLLAFMLLFLVLTALQSLPPIFMNSGVQSFNSLREIESDLNGFVLVLGAGLGLLIISSHLRNRTLKMVFTKPCPPALWLVSAFLSAAMVSLFLNLVVFSAGLLLSLLWHLPVRIGLAYVSAQTFVISLSWIAYLMLLASIMHPVLAAIVAIIFNADLFYEFQVWAQAAIRSGSNNLSLRTLEHVFHSLYVLLPMMFPFDKQTANIHVSLRVMNSEWKYIAFSFGYSLALSAFCYCTALYALQKRKHI